MVTRTIAHGFKKHFPIWEGRPIYLKYQEHSRDLIRKKLVHLKIVLWNSLRMMGEKIESICETIIKLFMSGTKQPPSPTIGPSTSNYQEKKGINGNRFQDVTTRQAHDNTIKQLSPSVIT